MCLDEIHVCAYSWDTSTWGGMPVFMWVLYMKFIQMFHKAIISVELGPAF